MGFLAVAVVGIDEERPEFLEPHDRRGRVHWCSVAPERWRLGIGRRLMESGIARLREWGCEVSDPGDDLHPGRCDSALREHGLR